MACAIARKPSIGITGPAVLWSVHFVIVYVFASLGCLWGWERYELLGVGAIAWGIAAVTVVIGGLIAILGVWQWREARWPRSEALPQTAQFVARVGLLSSALFLAATLSVGLLSLPKPSCY